MGKDNRGLRPYFKGVPLIIISQTHVSAQMAPLSRPGKLCGFGAKQGWMS